MSVHEKIERTLNLLLVCGAVLLLATLAASIGLGLLALLGLLS